MFSCTRKVHFCYGHRVMNHESKCATLHGHNGIVWIHASPIQGLDTLGRVIDFSILKEKIGGWIDTHWDHTTILYEKDTQSIELMSKMPQYKKLFILPTNPTAENLADYLLKVVCPQELKDTSIIVHKIVFWETENCYASASLE